MKIHGSWFDPSNPTVKMDQELRGDLWSDVIHWSQKIDLCFSIGTSLCGMEADCLNHIPSNRMIEEKSG